MCRSTRHDPSPSVHSVRARYARRERRVRCCAVHRFHRFHGGRNKVTMAVLRSAPVAAVLRLFFLCACWATKEAHARGAAHPSDGFACATACGAGQPCSPRCASLKCASPTACDVVPAHDLLPDELLAFTGAPVRLRRTTTPIGSGVPAVHDFAVVARLVPDDDAAGDNQPPPWWAKPNARARRASANCPQYCSSYVRRANAMLG